MSPVFLFLVPHVILALEKNHSASLDGKFGAQPLVQLEEKPPSYTNNASNSNFSNSSHSLSHSHQDRLLLLNSTLTASAVNAATLEKVVDANLPLYPKGSLISEPFHPRTAGDRGKIAFVALNKDENATPSPPPKPHKDGTKKAFSDVVSASLTSTDQTGYTPSNRNKNFRIDATGLDRDEKGFDGSKPKEKAQFVVESFPGFNHTDNQSLVKYDNSTADHRLPSVRTETLFQPTASSDAHLDKSESLRPSALEEGEGNSHPIRTRVKLERLRAFNRDVSSQRNNQEFYATKELEWGSMAQQLSGVGLPAKSAVIKRRVGSTFPNDGGGLGNGKSSPSSGHHYSDSHFNKIEWNGTIIENVTVKSINVSIAPNSIKYEVSGKTNITSSSISKDQRHNDANVTNFPSQEVNTTDGVVANGGIYDACRNCSNELSVEPPDVLPVTEPVIISTTGESALVATIPSSTNTTFYYYAENDTSFLNGSESAKVISEFPWPVKREAVVEGDLVLGGLMMVHEREDSVTCGPVMPQGGVQALEAMLYTLDRLNEPQFSLLPNITLGAHILDDCDKDTYGLEMAVDFIKGSISNIDGAEYHCNKTQVRKVISGVVGAASSVTSIQVANLLRLFKIPQVSFFSTSPELSNKQRFEYFTRTIPSDHYQVKAMVDIVRLMGWSYISIIYEESNYGIKAFEELEDLLADYNICIAVKEKLVKDSGVANESAYDSIVQKLLTKPRARGTIIFGSDQEVAGVMRAVKRSNATGSFSWIGSDGWSARSLVSDGNEAEVEGTLSVQPQANPVQGFKEYFLNLNVENNRRNPWFVEFWEDHFQCRYPNSSKTPYNKKYIQMCTGKEQLTDKNTVFEDQLQFVSDAVMAFAYAIRDMHKALCHGKSGLCDAMKPTNGTELLKYLRDVDFEGLSGDRFHFDKNGDGPARYNIIHFKQVSAGKYRWIRVGEYMEGELRLNLSEIQFKLDHPKPPESVCSLPCDQGQAKKYVEGESCCWHCFNCTQYQIRHPLDPTQCIGCPLGTVPDPVHVSCIQIPEEYLRPESGWAIGAMALSSTGILITVFVVCVFVRYNDTPVVRASGRELSYVLLAGILMCYCITFALVLRPSDIVCGIQRFFAGFCFTVVYAALLTKTNRISRIFNAGKHSAKRPSLISPKSQLMVCSGLVAVQVVINGVWMVISPAKAMHHYTTREDNILVCSTDIDASYMIAFTYPIFLIVVCTVYAVLTRKIPEAFNESKHIGFTMYTTCVIWLAFVPLYFGTANHVALRITSMSVTISLSASVTVACLFSPKLYIILIRPERNIRQSMMPMRYSAINKNCATAGSGTMMAPVMVTAATCDQKKQIQKHVPPLQREISEMEDTEMNNGRIKLEMIDCDTQTDGSPPPYSESVLNNTQEHMPKHNNNFNVGNGPLALLPTMQLKEIPL